MKPTFKVSTSSACYVAIGLPGLLGLAVIARTAEIYVGTDLLALAIMLAMGAGFVLGFVELCVRLVRAANIARETRAMPVPASHEAVEAASPALRAFLGARIEHAATPPAQESFTPYLVGLMVMLGLLGTLLGLFETLRGAGIALTASTDVDALRSGLSGPMRGLTRSFGCSAAGVMASAMLGLAAVFVRRGETRALSVVHAYANGPLRSLSPLRRQLDALDRLAVKGEALPTAAQALQRAADGLEDLAARWEAAHAAAAGAQRKAITDAVSRLGDDLDKTAARATRGMHDTLAPLIERSVAQTGEAAARPMSAVLEALERDIEGRRFADEALRKALREELNALRLWVEQDASTRADEAQQRLAVVDSAMRCYAEDQAAVLTMHREQAMAHVSALSGAAHELNAQRSEDAAARRAEAGSLLSDLAQRLEQAADARALQSREQLAAVAQLGERIVQQAEVHETALSERWERLAREHAAQGREAVAGVAALGARFVEQAELREAALSARWERLAKSAEESDLLRSEHTEQVAQRLDASLGNTALRVEQVLAQRSEADAEQVKRASNAFDALAATALSLKQVLSSLENRQTGHARQLAEELHAHAQNLGNGLESTTTLVHEAATVLKANSIEMSAVAEMFAASVERQREAATTWIESLGEIEGAVERAGRGAAADVLGEKLASTQEVFARQLQFLLELFEQLRALRMPSAQGHGQAERIDVSA